MTQRDNDLAALRNRGFSNLSPDQQARLVGGGDVPAPARKYNVGDLVGLDPDLASGGGKYRGVTFRVAKVNVKTYKLQPLNGGLTVNASKELVTSPPVTSTRAGTAQDAPLDPIAHLVCGTLVRVHNARSGAAYLNDGDLGVVLVDKGERVNVAPLGGFEDRYGRLPRRMLTVVDPKSVINEKPF